MVEPSLELLVTSACNFRCNYCYVDFTNEAMSYEVMKNSFDTFEEKYPGLEIVLFGGEPLLVYEDLTKLINYIRVEKKKANKIKVVTNGALLNKEMFEQLKLNNVFISLSYDGDKSQNMRVGKFNWDVFNYGIENCHKVISPENCLFLLDDITSTLDKGITYYTLAIAKSASWNKQSLKSLFYSFKQTYAWYLTNKAELDKAGVYLSLFENPIEVHKQFLKENIMQYSNCYAGMSRFSVNSTGDVYGCARMANLKIEKLGDLNNLPAEPTKFSNYSMSHCSVCEYRDYCEGACPSLNFEENGSFYQNQTSYCQALKMLYYFCKDYYENVLGAH